MATAYKGRREILGLYAGDRAKCWLHVLTEFKDRGVADVLMVMCDGLTGLPDAITAVWSKTITQTCIVHLLRKLPLREPSSLGCHCQSSQAGLYGGCRAGAVPPSLPKSVGA
ncbi:transposase [Amycolatopsis sp. BJA-103]|uniref:transposase n=1 Tax=Amycolatopsis sp. BJA-103 TaxID=1911175 RepID=UPI000C78EB3E|nr:hypothetical protein B1H26_41395 [Amycolatopsis sp. BJA-103]